MNGTTDQKIKSAPGAEDRSFDSIQIGDSAEFTQIWNDSDVVRFAELSGDHNPLHMDAEYAETTQFKNRIVHGMLVASSFSKLLGMHLPGKKCLYLKQNIVFKKPVYIGDSLKISGSVISKSESTRILEIELKISRGDEIVVEGLATVQTLAD